jgi:hypothetical protein
MKHLILVAACVALNATVSAAGFIPVASSDPYLVRWSRTRGYYRISADSRQLWEWGLGRAPVEEPSMLNRGRGNDVVAIPFDANGRVAFAPVYIYTIVPETFEENRLLRLVQGVSTKADVQALYGRVPLRSRVNGYEVWYYEISVFNPFEELPSGQGRQ